MSEEEATDLVASFALPDGLVNLDAMVCSLRFQISDLSYSPDFRTGAVRRDGNLDLFSPLV